MQVNLSGQIAMVTGAAGAIGRATADALIANGARVAYTDINFEGVKQATANQPGAIALKLDVSNEQEVGAVVDEIIRQWGRLDVLVNNAGVNTLSHRVNIDQFPTSEWDRILKVDLTGLFFVSRAAAKQMIEQRSGRIINISSVLGMVPARLQSPFVAAKAGVVNLTRSMAIELGNHGILVNCIAPGSIMTEGTKRLFYGVDGKFNDRAQAMLAHIPLGRPGKVDEIASTVLFLSAPESSYINGAVLPVDGGWLAGYIREF
jgi:NAD(P)-dependent dehydrogenase (short-subunit alcohol dehydrogenase family)